MPQRPTRLAESGKLQLTSKVENGEHEIVSANFKNIRLFTVPHLNGPERKRSFPMLYQWKRIL